MPRPISVLLILVAFVALGTAARGSVGKDRELLYARYASKLEDVAERCDAENLPDAAEAIRNWLPKRSQDHLTLFLPPATSSATAKEGTAKDGAAKKKAGSPAARVEWQGLRNEQADALMRLARQAVDEGQTALAFEMVVEALRENPNQEQARKLLGYTQFQGEWHTPFEIRQMRAGKVWHDRFGWIPKAYVKRYEKGERFAMGRWMSLEDELKLRSDLKRGWKIETDHYVVTTNHGLEEGVALAKRLETLHGIWRQVFMPFVAGHGELLKQFEGKIGRPVQRQHEVVYFRTRDEYNEALRSAQPQIEMTLGIYFDTTRTAYFFAGDEQDPGTLYHEGAHQLFQEMRSVAPLVAREDNFWIVEGIACYMESLTEQNGYYTLGGANVGRVPAARHRLMVDKFYVPLAELVAMGRETLQRDPRIAMLYSQSAGLADFFMQSDGGRRRDALNKYLIAIYTGRATPETLAEATGQPYDGLDAAYKAYIRTSAPAEEPTAEAPAEQASR
jgi:hypothetical protein